MYGSGYEGEPHSHPAPLPWMGSSGTTYTLDTQPQSASLTTIFASHLKTLISAFHQWHDLQLCFSHRLSWNPLRREFCCQDKNVSVLYFLCWSTESASVSSSALRPAGHLFLAHSGEQVLQGAQVLVKCYKLAELNFICVSECSTISPFQQKTCWSCIFKLSIQMVPRVKFWYVEGNLTV